MTLRTPLGFADEKAIKALAGCKYSCAVEPILELGEDGQWDYEMISRRTRQIKEIVWDTLVDRNL